MDACRTPCRSGIRQRLSLAVAMIHGPEMLILDEPTSGVDPVARDGFWQILIDLSRTRQGDDLHLDPLHERGRALRPHLADACRPGAGQRHAGGAGRRSAAPPRWRRPSSATWRTRSASRRRRRSPARTPAARVPAAAATPAAHATDQGLLRACAACSATPGARRWNCAAIRSAPRWRCSAASS